MNFFFFLNFNFNKQLTQQNKEEKKMPGKPFAQAIRKPVIKDAWDTDSSGEVTSRQPVVRCKHIDHESDRESESIADEIELTTGCRVSTKPAKNQKEDPVTLMKLSPGRTVTIISPNGESRLTYNISTLHTVARTNGKWLMPPHFREEIDPKLLELIRKIDPKIADSKLPKKRSDGDAHLDDDLIEELNHLEQEANEGVSYDQHRHLLSAFNLGDSVSRRNIYFCPYCWDEAVDDARSPENNATMEKPSFLCREDKKKGSQSGSDGGSEFNSEVEEDISKKNSQVDPTTRVQSVVDADAETTDEEEEEDEECDESSSNTSTSSSDMSVTGHFNMEVFEHKKQKLLKVRKRKEAKKQSSKGPVNEQQEYESMTMDQRREEYGLKDPLNSLWKVDDRVETWKNILFSTAQKCRSHIKNHHGGSGSTVVETLRDKITRYIESRNQRFMNSPWFDETKLTHQQVLAPSNHAYWFWFARYNVMRYNTMLKAVEQSDGTGSKFVTDKNAHVESDESSHICENSTSSSELQRRRDKVKQKKKRQRQARKSGKELTATTSDESSGESQPRAPSKKNKRKLRKSSNSDSSSNPPRAQQKRKKESSEEETAAF